MGFTEILLIMAIALILFGPEDLPNIARRIGKAYFEIRKVTNELTKEFQRSIDSPTNILNKAFEHTASPRIVEQVTHGAYGDSTNNELLRYEDEIPTDEGSSKDKADDLVVELPLGKYSIEKRNE